MFENYDEYMQKIAENLIKGANELDGWVEVAVNVERASDSSIGVQAEYLKVDGNTIYISGRKLLDNNINIFHKLYQTMTADTDKHKWNRAKATLTNDMKLNMEFEWDQELADELERLSKED